MGKFVARIASPETTVDGNASMSLSARFALGFFEEEERSFCLSERSDTAGTSATESTGILCQYEFLSEIKRAE